VGRESHVCEKRGTGKGSSCEVGNWKRVGKKQKGGEDFWFGSSLLKKRRGKRLIHCSAEAEALPVLERVKGGPCLESVTLLTGEKKDHRCWPGKKGTHPKIAVGGVRPPTTGGGQAIPKSRKGGRHQFPQLDQGSEKGPPEKPVP